MSKAKHTPGPWKINFEGTHIMAGPLTASGRVAVADVCKTPAYQANAALIAAAPDLLAALEKAARQIQNLANYEKDNEAKSHIVGFLGNHIMPVIHKARGQS